MQRHLSATALAFAIASFAGTASAQEIGADERAEAPAMEDADGGPTDRRFKIGGVTALTLGIVGVGVGTFLLVRSHQEEPDLNRLKRDCMLCASDPMTLDAAQAAERNDALAAIDKQKRDVNDPKHLSVLFYGLGVTGIASGIVLLSMRDGGTEQHASVTPFVGLGTAGLRGVF